MGMGMQGKGDAVSLSAPCRNSGLGNQAQDRWPAVDLRGGGWIPQQ